MGRGGSPLQAFSAHNPCPGEADTVRRRPGGPVEASYPTLRRAITMKTKLSLWLAATVVLTGMVLVLSWVQTATRVHAASLDPSTPARVPGNRVLARALEIELGLAKPAPYEQLLSSGPVRAVLQASGELDRRAAAVAVAPDAEALTALSSLLTQGCQDVLT